jgi:S-adenosylmethionine:tRNA ribosyltransferase-isomerase
VRTLESLYWLGVKMIQKPSESPEHLSLGQWEPYEMTTNISSGESLFTLLNFLKEKNLNSLMASTSIMIVPGYDFRLTNGMITNSHFGLDRKQMERNLCFRS